MHQPIQSPHPRPLNSVLFKKNPLWKQRWNFVNIKGNGKLDASEFPLGSRKTIQPKRALAPNSGTLQPRILSCKPGLLCQKPTRLDWDCTLEEENTGNEYPWFRWSASFLKPFTRPIVCLNILRISPCCSNSLVARCTYIVTVPIIVIRCTSGKQPVHLWCLWGLYKDLKDRKDPKTDHL